MAVSNSQRQVTHSEEIVTVAVNASHGRGVQARFRVSLQGDHVEIHNWQQSATWRMGRELAEGLRDALVEVLRPEDEDE